MGETITNKKSKINVFNITLLGILTAMVILLQSLGATIRFGTFSITLVLLPIVIGAAMIHPLAGGWLGFVFSIVVLFTDAGAFLAVNIIGTVITVILKGTLAGIAAGYAYKLLAKRNSFIATIAAAAAAPIVNTGVFILGSYIFFYPTIAQWATTAGFTNATAFIFLALVGWNFILELAVNIVLSPTITFLLKYGRSRIKS
jgi:Predicted membrane protein